MSTISGVFGLLTGDCVSFVGSAAIKSWTDVWLMCRCWWTWEGWDRPRIMSSLSALTPAATDSSPSLPSPLAILSNMAFRARSRTASKPCAAISSTDGTSSPRCLLMAATTAWPVPCFLRASKSVMPSMRSKHMLSYLSRSRPLPGPFKGMSGTRFDVVIESFKVLPGFPWVFVVFGRVTGPGPSFSVGAFVESGTNWIGPGF